MGKLIAAAALTAGAFGAIGGAVEAAEPQSVIGVTKGFATTYSSPSNQTGVVHHLPANTEVSTMCFREGQVLNGNPLWFIVNVNGESGYIHRDLIAVPEGSLGHC